MNYQQYEGYKAKRAKLGLIGNIKFLITSIIKALLDFCTIFVMTKSFFLEKKTTKVKNIGDIYIVEVNVFFKSFK